MERPTTPPRTDSVLGLVNVMPSRTLYSTHSQHWHHWAVQVAIHQNCHLVFRRLPEPELAVAEPVLADLSACRAKPSAFINRAKLGRAEPMEMPLWEGSGSGSSWPEPSLAPGTMSAAWGALRITRPPIAANFPLRYHS